MIRIEFRLTMPGRGSWDNKWSGEGRNYLLVRDVGADLAGQLDGQTWSYAWEGGWRAEVSARILPEDETLRYSHGFHGYEWMVASILQYGKIYADPDGGAPEPRGAA